MSSALNRKYFICISVDEPTRMFTTGKRYLGRQTGAGLRTYVVRDDLGYARVLLDELNSRFVVSHWRAAPYHEEKPLFAHFKVQEQESEEGGGDE